MTDVFPLINITGRESLRYSMSELKLLADVAVEKQDQDQDQDQKRTL
ncbi:unnamed protein product, partial [marine sediment metagenome]